MKEDCLYINVWAPPVSQIDRDSSGDDDDDDNDDDSLLPVMIYIHGGDYYEGYSGSPLYNGTNLSNLTNIVVVSMNYRLGVLGFFWFVLFSLTSFVHSFDRHVSLVFVVLRPVHVYCGLYVFVCVCVLRLCVSYALMMMLGTM